MRHGNTGQVWNLTNVTKKLTQIVGRGDIFPMTKFPKPIWHLTKFHHISLPTVLSDMQEAVEGVPHLEQDGNRSRMEPTNLKASYRTNGAEMEPMYRRVLGAEWRLRTMIKDNRAGD